MEMARLAQDDGDQAPQDVLNDKTATTSPENVLRFHVHTGVPLGITVNNNTQSLWKIGTLKRGSQADELGMRVGDFIYSLGGKNITADDHLEDIMGSVKARAGTYEIVMVRDLSFADTVDKEIETFSFPRATENGRPAGAAKEGRKNRNDPAGDSAQSSSNVESAPQSGAAKCENDDLKWHKRLATIPFDTVEGIGQAEYGSIWDECEKRVKMVCINLCLLPPGKKPRLSDAVNLVFASLCYEAPYHGIKKRNDESSWIHGIKPKLHGPQPWVMTRKFIIQRIEEMLESDEIPWMASAERRKELMEKNIPLIKKYLITWKSSLSDSHMSDTLQKYAKSVWDRFALDHFGGGRDVSVLHKLTESYIHVVAAKLEIREMCPSVPGSVDARKEKVHTDAELKGLVMDRVTELKFDLIPFMTEASKAVVCDGVLERLKANFSQLHTAHISTALIDDILNDLEYDANFLTVQNELLKVRVKQSELFPLSKQESNVICIGSDNASTGGEESLNAKDPRNNLEADSFRAEDDILATPADTKLSSGSTISAEDEIDGVFDDDISSTAESSDTTSSRVLSSKMTIGSRVYAEFSNGDYYWGDIARTKSSRKGMKKYTVHFEDGDVLDNIADTNIFTEVEYKRIFNKEPPKPHFFPSRQRRKRGHWDTPNQSEKKKTQSKKKEKKKKRSLPSANNSISRKRKCSFDEKSISSRENPQQEVKATVAKNKDNRIPIERPLLPNDVIASIKDEALNPRKLRKRRCKNCSLCRKDDCGQCSMCLRNRSVQRKSKKEVCIRKMCCKIPNAQKTLPAVGFSPGWSLLFEEPKASFRSIHEKSSVPGLTILAPDGSKFYSVKNAAIHDTGAISDQETICQQFCAHIGLSSYQSDPSHFLVGKGFCQEWTNVRGQKRVIFGTITRCMKEIEDDGGVKFVIAYSNESRLLVNSISNGFSRGIPLAEEIPSALAWGGCVSFERKHHVRRGPGSVVKNINRSVGCESWLTPDIREEAIMQSNGKNLPKLTMTFRGFKLVFAVKESSIPGAGLGVFCSCTSLLDNTSSSANDIDGESFDLKPGELLDLGVYAPLRCEDKKHRCVFHLKNFVHSMECEEWCFNSTEADYQYDITNDTTRGVHEIAKRHLLTYVNECNSNECPSVYARLDPEGSVHYLLGVAYHGVWEDFQHGMEQFNLRSGNEVEIFVNYGEGYEDVRIRKGYSTLPEEIKSKRLFQISNNQETYLDDIDEYSKEEIAKATDFFLQHYTTLYRPDKKDMDMDNEIRDRALQVAMKLKVRVNQLEIGEQEKDSTVFDCQSSRNKFSDLMELIDTLVQKLSTAPSTSKLPSFEELPKKSKIIISSGNSAVDKIDAAGPGVSSDTSCHTQHLQQNHNDSTE